MTDHRHIAPARFARALRQRPTDAENRLWRALRDRRLRGWKFRRQQPMGGFVVDFFCAEANLIIEIDGGQHDLARDADYRRTAYLELSGNTVLRFWNSDVMTNLDGLLERIREALHAPSP